MAVSQVLTTAAQFSAITLYTLKAPDVALVGPQEGRDTDTFLKGWMGEGMERVPEEP